MCHIKIYQNKDVINLNSGGVLLRGALRRASNEERDGDEMLDEGED